MKRILVLLCLSISLTASFAAIYEQEREDGSMILTNKPELAPNGATILPDAPAVDNHVQSNTAIEKVQTKIPQQRPTASSAAKKLMPQALTTKIPKAQLVNDVMQISIDSPKNMETFHNQRFIPIKFSLAPALEKGDIIDVYVDANSMGSTTSTEFMLSNLDRGEHTIYATIARSKTATTQTSKPITIYVHYTSVKQRRKK